MRNIEVCKKCKWFRVAKRNGRVTCNAAYKLFPFFDYDYYIEREFKTRELHPNCPLKMEQMIMLDGEE